MLRLHCVAQQYSWGKPGSTSAVAQLKSKGEGVAIEEGKPYAEYWFGTHPSGPSKVVLPDGSEQLLQDWLLAHPSALGGSPYNADSALPYLFKVLSVAQALSVQAHPDKALAERLHAGRPDLYKDDNHKPELACALTPFEAMCGFRSPSEIAAHVAAVPELRAMVGDARADALVDAAAAVTASTANAGDAPPPARLADAFKAALRDAFTAFMSAPPDGVATHTAALAARIAAAPPPAAAADDGSARLLAPEAVVARLLRDFPGDVGVFAPYWLNTLRLRPGEAVFLGANDPHAYLAGDCMEIMACSDNVVRAGLTPKFKDVPTLTSMLTYASGAPPVDAGAPLDAYTTLYTPPVPEFQLQRVALPAGLTGAGYTLPPVAGAAVVVVVSGAATARCQSCPGGEASTVSLSEGQVWLQPADVGVTLTSDGGALLFRSHPNPALTKKAQ